MEDVDVVSNAMAASILRCTTKRWGDTPVAVLNNRAK